LLKKENERREQHEHAGTAQWIQSNMADERDTWVEEQEEEEGKARTKTETSKE
jgi:hypothetical protein